MILGYLNLIETIFVMYVFSFLYDILRPEFKFKIFLFLEFIILVILKHFSFT